MFSLATVRCPRPSCDGAENIASRSDDGTCLSDSKFQDLDTSSAF